MNWTLQYNSTLSIIELVFTGHNTGHDLREATSQAIALGKKHDNQSFFVDAMDIELSAGLFDLYNLPAKQYEAETLDRRIREAIVLPKSPKYKDDVRFYETACTNRGWNVKSFLTRDEAIEWLTGTGSSDKADAGHG